MVITAPVSLSKIKSVFGGGNKLSEYVRGGSIVPIGAKSTISTNVNGLAISQFLGASKPPSVNFQLLETQLTATGDTDVDYEPGYASIILYSDGGYEIYETHWIGSGHYQGIWFNGSLNNVECRQRLNLGNWSDFGTFSDQYVSASAGNDAQTILDIEFRIVGTQTNLGTIRLWAIAN